jgi:general secretion pathway protein D
MTSSIFRYRRYPAATLSMIFAALLGSCATPMPLESDPASAGSPETMPGRLQVTARVNGRVQPDPTIAKPLVQHIVERPPAGPVPFENFAGEDGAVSLNYVDADIRQIVRLVLGDILKLNYSIEPGVMGTVSIHTSQPLRRDALLSTLEGLIEQIGGTMTFSNGIFRIGLAGDETKVPAFVAGANLGAGSQVVTLRYASAQQLVAMLRPYVGDAARMSADPGRNLLIVSGTASARQNIIDLVRVFDVDYLAGQSYALFAAKSGDPAKLIADLTAALQLSGDSPLSGAIRLVAIEEASAVMVITQQPAYLNRVAGLIAELERVREDSGRQIHVYYLKNTDAANVQPVLQRAVNPPTGGATGEIAPGELPPTAAPARVTSPADSFMIAGIALQGANSGQMAPGAVNVGQQQQQPRSTEPQGDLQQEANGANARGPQIIADRTNNALLVVATEGEYATIEAAIRKLDILPLQVLIEATIAEVTLNDSLQYGTQYYLLNGDTQATLSNAQSFTATPIDPTMPLTNAQLFPGTLAPNFPGFAFARAVGNQQFAIQALKKITDVEIISAPKLLVLDNQLATLQVGQLVPTITQSATSVITSGAPVVNNVQYQATGVILTVTPRINSGGLVTLDIQQEVSDVVPTTTSSIDSPTFQQRKIQTKVVIQDGETVSLAGLISDKRSKENTGIPILQEIPLLGPLFSTRTNSTTRTELLILLTPRVVYDSRDARALTDELRRKLEPSRLVP